MTPLAGVGLLCALLARKYTLKRNFVKAGDQRPGSGSGSGSGGETATSESVATTTDKSAAETEEKIARLASRE